MSRAAQIARIVIAAIASTGLMASLSATSASAWVPASRCAFSTLIGVRGTDEPAGSGSANGGRTYASGGLGDAVDSIANYARSDKNLPIYVEALNYPATAYQAPFTTYINSVNVGVARLAAEVENLASSCPSTNILLVGYSQGAHVISNMLSGSNPPAFTTVSLSPGARAHIKAVVLLASPSFRPGQSWNAPNQARTTAGLFPADAGKLSAWTALAWNSNYTARTQQPIVREWCFEGDAFCQSAFPNGMTIHRNYWKSSAVAEAWGFIYQKITSNE